MKIDIITLFPDMFKGPFDMSMMWKAQERGLASIDFHDLREFGLGPRRTVDDTPYGGGDGMLLKPEPVVAAIEHAKEGNKNAKVIILSPQGKRFDQAYAAELTTEDGLILVAGHYEGFDERIIAYADIELSIGDYVLTGGELPVMTVVDAVVRLIPGVLGGEQSTHVESFSDGLLEYPQYTRPVEFRGQKVPDVLQNGHHAEIEAWRAKEAAAKTKRNRPDLLK
ncbi:MAG TPA: tRNA (guanosine(37)-N1)-methyltransferase TrmD [Candidatus Saccharimonadia bacterium]